MVAGKIPDNLQEGSHCVAISQLGLTRETLETRKAELQSVVLAAARGELLQSGEIDGGGDTEFAEREARSAERQQALDALCADGGGLPWDVLPTGNPDEDEENHAKAMLVVGEYFADFQEPLGQRLWDACMGKELLENSRRKTRKNRGKWAVQLRPDFM